MRVSTGHQFETYSSQVSRTQAQMFEAQRQLSSGKRILNPGDDPLGTRISLGYKSLQSAVNQYSKNLQSAKGWLGFTEQSTAEAGELVKRAYQLAIQGANGSTDQTGRNAMVTEVIEIQRRLTDLANTQGPGGQYIFAGQNTDTKPFVLAGSVLNYTGDANSMNVETGPNETLAMNSQMGTTFPDIYAKLEDLKNYLQGGDIASLSGVSISALQSSIDALVQERGRVGTKLQTVEQGIANNARRAEEFTKNITEVEDVDLAEAILKYQQAETAYSAALQVASQGFGLSLLDFIRG